LFYDSTKQSGAFEIILKADVFFGFQQQSLINNIVILTNYKLFPPNEKLKL
jgi:hypothetical protein